MRALLCRQYGEPATLTVEETPTPVPGHGELLVNVKAAGVNFPDVLMIQNKYQHRPQLPFTPGYEIAGVAGQGMAGLARRHDESRTVQVRQIIDPAIGGAMHGIERWRPPALPAHGAVIAGHGDTRAGQPAQ